MTLRKLGAGVFGAVSAAMLGLAAGAVWMVASLYMRQPLPSLALPIGALLAWTIRAGVLPPGGRAAGLAALATLLAAIYVNLLIAGISIAGTMNMGLIESLRVAGFGMLWQLAQLAIQWSDLTWALAGSALAAWLASRPRRPRQTKA